MTCNVSSLHFLIYLRAMCVQELYREYTDLTRRHEAEVAARHSQQQSNVESLHGITTDTAAAVGTAAGGGDGNANTTKERLSRMVGVVLMSVGHFDILHSQTEDSETIHTVSLSLTPK